MGELVQTVQMEQMTVGRAGDAGTGVITSTAGTSCDNPGISECKAHVHVGLGCFILYCPLHLLFILSAGSSHSLGAILNVT